MNNTTDFTLLLDNGHGSKVLACLLPLDHPPLLFYGSSKAGIISQGEIFTSLLEFSDWQGLIDFSPKQGGLVAYIGAAS